ncbi:YqzM family protein [Sporosarcina sp. FSL K6-1522]
MNEFEHDVQSKRNDAIDSGIGFAVAFVGFSAIFIIATIIDFIAS